MDPQKNSREKKKKKIKIEIVGNNPKNSSKVHIPCLAIMLELCR